MQTFAASNTRKPAVWLGGMVVPLLAALFCSAASSTLRADDGLGVRKVDPLTGNSVPIAPAKLRRGNIYSHFDAALNRRVWSHWLGNGQFGMALGPGTAQPAKLFNINLEPRLALELLRKWDSKLADDTVREGTEVFLRLSADQHWRLTRTSVAMIYDAQTGYRFEQQFGRYIPVSHMDGYRWRPVGGRFEAVP